MSEFIVWDDIKQKFTKDVTCFMSFNADGTINSFNGFGETKYFQYIGKKDISNKKIYADCSIVEFDLKKNHPLEMYSKECGVFKYSNETLSYYIDLLNGNYLGFGRWERVKDIKIIDTIQENKLNLIK